MKSTGPADTAIERLRSWRAEIAIILGSGLNAIVPNAPGEEGIAYTEFKELPRPSVPGHSGRFVFGAINETRMIFAQGRVHLYEGLSGRDVTAATRILAEAGIKTLIVTKLADTNDGVCDADCSLREAVASAWANDTINFAPGLTGTIALNSGLVIDKNMEIYGPGCEEKWKRKKEKRKYENMKI